MTNYISDPFSQFIEGFSETVYFPITKGSLPGEKIDESASVKAKKEGNDHFKRKKFDLAIICYTEAIRHDKRCEKCALNRGYCYFLKKRYGLASKDLRRAIFLNPHWSKAWARLALCFLATLDFRLAKICIRTAIDLSSLENSQILQIEKSIDVQVPDFDMPKAFDIRTPEDIYEAIQRDGKCMMSLMEKKCGPFLSVEHRNEAVRTYLHSFDGPFEMVRDLLGEKELYRLMEGTEEDQLLRRRNTALIFQKAKQISLPAIDPAAVPLIISPATTGCLDEECAIQWALNAVKHELVVGTQCTVMYPRNRDVLRLILCATCDPVVKVDDKIVIPSRILLSHRMKHCIDYLNVELCKLGWCTTVILEDKVDTRKACIENQTDMDGYNFDIMDYLESLRDEYFLYIFLKELRIGAAACAGWFTGLDQHSFAKMDYFEQFQEPFRICVQQILSRHALFGTAI